MRLPTAPPRFCPDPAPLYSSPSARSALRPAPSPPARAPQVAAALGASRPAQLCLRPDFSQQLAQPDSAALGAAGVAHGAMLFCREDPAGAKALSPAKLKKALTAHLVTHCEHGTLRTEHCPWCHIDTPEYRRTLADAMWTVLP